MSGTFTSEGEAITGFIEYDTSLFTRETVERLAKDLATVLETIANEPEMKLADLKNEIMSADEKRETETFLQSIMEVNEDF